MFESRRGYLLRRNDLPTSHSSPLLAVSWDLSWNSRFHRWVLRPIGSVWIEAFGTIEKAESNGYAGRW